jgi:serine/threonine-protein kinase RsbW
MPIFYDTLFNTEFLLLGIFEMAESAPLLPVMLECNTDLRFIDLIQVVGGELLKHLSFTQEDGEMIWLAIQEGIANAMRHGNKLDKTKSVTVKFVPSYEHIEIQITDEGEGLDLESVPNPNLPENLLKPSGRGIFFMKQVMDSVSVCRTNSGNTLVLTKRRKVRDKGVSN